MISFRVNCCDFPHRMSGVTDHLALNDEHALTLARSIVANLNWKQTTDINLPEVFL